MDFSNYEFRCSSLGKIISKSGKMTQTIQTYLTEKFVEEVTNTRKQIHSKYFDKGNACEPESIQLLQDTLYPIEKGHPFINSIKDGSNRKNNGWITGELDVDVYEYIYDIKNAYDKYTFELADFTWEYQWQGKGYMWLYGKEKFRLFYTLNNLPEFLLEREERNLLYNEEYRFTSEIDPRYIEACEKLRADNNYDHLENYERFKIWEIEHNESDIDVIKDSIVKAREYMQGLWDKRQEFISTNKKLMGL